MSKLQSLFYSVLLTLFVLTRVLAMRNRQDADMQRQPYGRYTRQEAISLAEPILQALLPQNTELYLTAQSNLVAGRGGKRLRLWSVACTDAKGKELAVAERDADTGLLWLVSSARDASPTLTAGRPLSSSEATKRAMRWIRLLGAPQRWLPIGGPKPSDITWSIALKSSDQRAYVVLDRCSGSLLYAKFLSVK